VSLSKKLRDVLGKGGGTIVLTTYDLENGKGLGTLSLSSEAGTQYSEIPEILLGETSIQITPVEIADETPSNSSPVHAAIFSTIPKKGENAPVIDKLAAVHPPEKGEEAHAVVAKEDVTTPDLFAQGDNKACKTWIGNMEELIRAISDAKGKSSDIDPDMAHNDRERALLLELKERDEAIDKPAWIVNTGGGTLIINDLDITLPIASPYDLSNISARRIIMSRDLKELIKGGYVKFLSPEEKDKFILGTDQATLSVGLDVFDSPEQAEAHMASSVSQNPIIDDKNAIDITASDLENPTEGESMVMNLTQDMPETKVGEPLIPTETSRHTTHGSPAQSGNAKSPAISPVRKLT